MSPITEGEALDLICKVGIHPVLTTFIGALGELNEGLPTHISSV